MARAKVIELNSIEAVQIRLAVRSLLLTWAGQAFSTRFSDSDSDSFLFRVIPSKERRLSETRL